MQEKAKSLVQDYYAAFNAQQLDAILELLSDDVIHDIGQGRREFGKDAYARFVEDMGIHCQEHIFDIAVMTNDDGTRAAAEFTVLGSYSRPDALAEPGQTYRVPGGMFFEVRHGKITRISSYSALQEWLVQATRSGLAADTGGEDDWA